jgi:uncharacterized protein YlxP (DUF503 family)
MTVHVGTARIALELPEGSSLKDKRQVVRSVVQRLRNRFNLSVAEVETLNSISLATLALACVSNDARHTQEMLDKAVAFIEEERLDADVSVIDTEIISL